MTPVDFLIVEGRIKEELKNLARLRESLARRKLLDHARQRRLKLQDEWLARGVGSILHDYYSAIEKAFRIIARDIDGKIPSNSEWHRELLSQMMLEIPGIRPSVISAELSRDLHEFLSFRHVFRNIYGFNLAAEKLDLLLEKFPRLHERVMQEITEFLQEMHKIMEG